MPMCMLYVTSIYEKLQVFECVSVDKKSNPESWLARLTNLISRDVFVGVLEN